MREIGFLESEESQDFFALSVSITQTIKTCAACSELLFNKVAMCKQIRV